MGRIMRPFFSLLLLTGVICSPATLYAQSNADRAVSQQFLDAFLMTERAKLFDRVQKEQDNFDLQKTFGNLDKKHEKVFGTRMSEGMILEFQKVARDAASRPPDPDARNRRSATETDPAMFMANARVKFLEDIREEGDKFNLEKEWNEYSSKFEKHFGMPMPANLQQEFFKNADLARSALQVERATGTNTATNGLKIPMKLPPTLTSTSTQGRGPRYPDGLPSWFQLHDRNRDGQVGLYEWERDRLGEFKTWDLNADGFIEPQEALRVLRKMNPMSTRPPGR